MKKILSFFERNTYLGVLTSVIYLTLYLGCLETPGNAPFNHPEGWWGWFDQRQYLRSAEALGHLNLSPEYHYYPPLYPWLGSIFLRISSGHPFFWPNLICFLFFAWVFIEVCSLYVHRRIALLLLALTSILNYEIFHDWIIPWTTTLSAAFLSVGLFGLFRLQKAWGGGTDGLQTSEIVISFLCLGLLAPTRPADAVVGAVIGAGIVFGQTYLCLTVKNKKGLGQFFSLAAISYLIGPAIYLAFNWAVFGGFSGGYAQSIGANGFSYADIFEKFVSIWLDSATLYGESHGALSNHYPWLVVSLAGIAYFFLVGDLFLRTLSLAILCLYLIYLPYNDLLPNGLWRFHNIHYFKWTFPYLGLLGTLYLFELWKTWRQKSYYLAIIGLSVPLLISSIKIKPSMLPIAVERSDFSEQLSISIHALPSVDIVDVNGLGGGFTEIYFGNHHIFLDGKSLTPIKDYRALPMPWGIRYLFTRPIHGGYLQINPERNITQDHWIEARVGIYQIRLSPQSIFLTSHEEHWPNSKAKGNHIQFSQGGKGLSFLSSGWSHTEAWGTWSNAEQAEMILPASLFPKTAGVAELFITFKVFVNPQHPCQRLKITASEKMLAEGEVCFSQGGANLKTYHFTLRREIWSERKEVTVRLSLPMSKSPMDLGISPDSRRLGVGISEVGIWSKGPLSNDAEPWDTNRKPSP